MTGQKRDAAYWRRRIEREYPEIAERLRSGAIPSVRAAAIEAGLIHDPSPLLELRRAWKKASAEERAAFIAEISLAILASPPVLARLENRHHAARAGAIDQGELFAERRAAAKARSAGGIALIPEHATAGERPEGRRAGNDHGHPSAAYPSFTARRIARQDYQSEVARPSVASGAQLSNGGQARPSRPWNVEPAGEADAEVGRAPAAKAEIADSRVRVGQRYMKLDAGPMAWEVLSVFAGPQNMPHARIASVEEPDTVRVVSVAALTDRRRYQRV